MKVRSLAAAAVFVFTALALADRSQAAYVFNVTQVGPDVQVTGSGSINLTGLGFVGSAPNTEGIYTRPYEAVMNAGAADSIITVYLGVTGPASFGSGDTTNATVASGDFVIVGGTISGLGVPGGYVSGAPLSSSATFAGQSFSSLGLLEGTYVYIWGAGGDADFLTVNIGTVPEPASAMLVCVAAGLGMMKRHRKA